MDIRTRLKNLDLTTKGIIIVFVVFVAYLLAMFILKPFIIADAIPSHSSVMGDHIMNFASPIQQKLNVISILVALAAGLCASLFVRTAQRPAEAKQPLSKEEELPIVKKALSADEKRMLEEVEKAGEITQDSLRFRLGWSKAKVSAIVSTLDKMDIVQRERHGKTYNVLIRK